MKYLPRLLANTVKRAAGTFPEVGDLDAFNRFLLLVAARTGNLLNLAELGREAGIGGPSAKHWLSVLEASQIVKLVGPYHRNFGKRIRSWKPPLFPNGSRPAETGASSPGCTTGSRAPATRWTS